MLEIIINMIIIMMIPIKHNRNTHKSNQCQSYQTTTDIMQGYMWKCNILECLFVFVIYAMSPYLSQLTPSCNIKKWKYLSNWVYFWELFDKFLKKSVLIGDP